MNFVVSMIRNSSEAGGRDRFECSSAAWASLLELGQAYGWKPTGTSYVPIDDSNATDTIVLHDYSPGDRRDRKYISADDAKAWAAALVHVRATPNLQEILARGGSSLEGVALSPGAITIGLLDEFVEYCFGGVFSFAHAG